MKKGFPNRILGFPVGWKDRGRVANTYNPEDDTRTFDAHPYCGSAVHIGLEKGEKFKFCPKCLFKFNDKK